MKSDRGTTTRAVSPLGSAAVVKSNGADPSPGVMRNSAAAVPPAGTLITAENVMSSVPMYPYGAENPHGSEAEPLSGAGLVPKVVGDGRVVAAAAGVTRAAMHAAAASAATAGLRQQANIRAVLMGAPS